jgi:hypothetical protein
MKTILSTNRNQLRIQSNSETPALSQPMSIGKSLVLLALLVSSVTCVQAASYSGAHLSSGVPAQITLGVEIPVTTTIQNTGTLSWDSYDQPGYIYKFASLSWLPGVSITHYVWDDVPPHSQASDTRTLSGADLPKAPGTYQFTVYVYYPVDDYSGDYLLMQGSPKRIQFTVASAPPPPPVLKVRLPSGPTHGQVELQLTGPAGGRYVIEASSDFSSWTPLATNSIPSTGVCTLTEKLTDHDAHRVYRAVAR